MSTMPGGLTTCPHCGNAEVVTGSRFCDGCGKPMPMPAAATAACGCGSTSFDSEGFCQNCGVRQRTRRAQEDAISLGDGLAGATDVGRRHTRNDDAFAAAGPAGGGAGSIFVVCDGVSNSQAADIGSAAAAKVALETLSAALAAGTDACAAVRGAILQAHSVVCTVPLDRQGDVDPPASTIVTAVIRQGAGDRLEAVVGWLGDSRVYWLSRSGGKLLTRDHSLANAMIDEGRGSEPLTGSQAHAITKCLGSTDFGSPTPCPEPSVEVFDLPAEGWLLACTDGLWGYAETPASLVLAANGKLWTAPAADVCQQFIQFARMRGGVDNITAVLARLG